MRDSAISLTSYLTYFLLACALGNEVKILRYRNDLNLTAGQIIEVRGIVNKDRSISFGEYTAYDTEFDLVSYESMLSYFHGMCKELCFR